MLSLRPDDAEVARACPGDDVVERPDAVMDRAFTLAAPPAEVWPWIVQLGKARAGWYLPSTVERLVPRPRRALRHVEPRWQSLAVGDVVPDWGGASATFRVVELDAPRHLVYDSRRGRVDLSWSIMLTPRERDLTRVHLRLRLGPLRRPWLADTAGSLVDRLTVAGLAAGLAERLAESRAESRAERSGRRPGSVDR